jgi:HAMP domain-containing protein
MRYRLGLRLKFNALILPVLAVLFGLVVAADYRHEVATVLAAHAMHEGPAGSVGVTRPIDPATTPDAAGRATLVMHAWFAVVMLGAVLAAINTTLSVLVLRPLGRIRVACAQMERGHWSALERPAPSDDIGVVAAAFRQLGLVLGMSVGQTVQAERLATLAMLARTTASAIEPEVARIGTSIAGLQASSSPDARQEAAHIGRAAAAVLSAVHGLDHAFEAQFRRMRTHK